MDRNVTMTTCYLFTQNQHLTDRVQSQPMETEAPIKHRRSNGRRLSEQERLTIATLHGQNVRKSHIAKALDVAPATVYNVLNKMELVESIQRARGIVGGGLPLAAIAVTKRITYEEARADKGVRPTTSEAALRGMGVFQPEIVSQVGIFSLSADALNAITAVESTDKTEEPEPSTVTDHATTTAD